MATKRKLADGDELEIIPLGAGQEVGRSCAIMQFKGRKIMFDCGIHPAYTGMASLPFLDEVDASTIDLCLVTHFHLDHCAALPYLMEKTTFKGRVFMTHPSKAIYRILLTDYVKVSNTSEEDLLFSEKDLLHSLEKIELLDYHQEIEHNGIKFTCFNAGHVLGAAMFMVEIAGVRVLYTGDFSRQEDRHLLSAEIPDCRVDVLVVESTYGSRTHEPRVERERVFTSWVRSVVASGGRCLIPVFALGRAQELLLILDEYWEAHPELQSIPIYYASSLANRCMGVYETYINMMNNNIRSQYPANNPWVFKHIQNLRHLEDFDDIGPSVVMASPGMLQSGLSRQLFERWCGDSRNGVILPGYCVEGTLAKQIISEPDSIVTLQGATVPLRCAVQSISFSAHSDFLQTSEFIKGVKAPHVVLVHGERGEMNRLKVELERRFVRDGDDVKEISESRSADKDRIKPLDVRTPANTESASFEFRGERIAKLVGKAAGHKPKHGQFVRGVVIRKDFSHHVLAVEELSDFTNLATTEVRQRMHVPFRQALSLLESRLKETFEGVQRQTVQKRESVSRDVLGGEEMSSGGDQQEKKSVEMASKAQLIVAGKVLVTQEAPNKLVLEFESGVTQQTIADTVLATAVRIESESHNKLLGLDDLDMDLSVLVDENLRLVDKENVDKRRKEAIRSLVEDYFGNCRYFEDSDAAKRAVSSEQEKLDSEKVCNKDHDEAASTADDHTVLDDKSKDTDGGGADRTPSRDADVTQKSADTAHSAPESDRDMSVEKPSAPGGCFVVEVEGELAQIPFVVFKARSKEQAAEERRRALRKKILNKQGDAASVDVSLSDFEIICRSEKLRNRIDTVIQRIRRSLFPVPDYWCGCCG